MTDIFLELNIIKIITSHVIHVNVNVYVLIKIVYNYCKIRVMRYQRKKKNVLLLLTKVERYLTMPFEEKVIVTFKLFYKKESMFLN